MEKSPTHPDNHLRRVLLISATLLASWLGMQAVHELGHVLGAWATGGVVNRVVLHPLTISRTDVAPNPQPLLVVWDGPVCGVVFPLGLWLLSAALRLPGTFLWRFFAGFCLLANGLYIGAGSFSGAGDCGDMLRHGSPLWTLWLFGLFTAPAGLWLWNGQRSHFGIGPKARAVSWRMIVSVTAVAAGLLAVGVWSGK